jgi:prepilin-type N-terminal cleavage/methylation domain-containing protein
MKRNRQQALTLIETLVSLAVMSMLMTAGYMTIHESLKLHQSNADDSNRLLARCHLAERLSADLLLHQQVVTLAPDRWGITRADGEDVIYRQEHGRVLREDQAGSRTTFEVGRVEVAVAAATVRLRFPDVELVFAR